MEIPLYIVDAFTSRVFGGNPAAVCPLESWPDEQLLLNIAAENNLSETAFLVAGKDAWNLRWFTPKVEIDLCGHATLASAFVLALDKNTAAEQYRFQSRSGELKVNREEDWYYLDFPARPLEEPENHEQLLGQVQTAVGLRPLQVTKAASTLIAEFDNETAVRSLLPVKEAILELECNGLIVTASGDNCDFVSRFFAPRVGIDEDPVTGSAHCGLIPYWHRKTGKVDMQALQVSERGGELRCHHNGDRVAIGGQAALFSQGTICI